MIRARIRAAAAAAQTLAGAAALALAGCGNPPPPQIVTKIQIERIQIPQPLLDVSPMPTVPQINVTEGELANYITRLWQDDMDKTSQLTAIATLQQQQPPAKTAAQTPSQP
jgi:hypothetical protein